MNKFMFFANWKMNLGWFSAQKYVQAMLNRVPLEKQKHFVFLSPALILPLLKDMLKDSAFSYGGQNCHFEDQGAWTGENSPLVLKELGATYSLVGHSERRTSFFENNTLIQKKIKALLKHGLHPVVCVGETAKEREQGQTFKILKQQIHPVFSSLKVEATKKPPHLYIAYEPQWAIGTGQSATVKDIVEIQTYIQQLFKLQEIQFKFLYGGSVNTHNSHALSKIPGVEGFLIGNSSLKVDTFLSCANHIIFKP